MTKKHIKVGYPIFKVVADGGLSVPTLGEGRFIPNVMIDIMEIVEIDELLKIHENAPPGDTELQWSIPSTLFSKPKYVLLTLTFLKPMQIQFGIEFSIAERHAVVDGIIQARAFNLQVGKSGDKISTIFVENNKEKTHGCVLIEVPNTGFDTKWNELLLDFVKHNYKKMGVPKSEATSLAKEQIKKMREVWNIRRPND